VGFLSEESAAALARLVALQGETDASAAASGLGAAGGDAPGERSAGADALARLRGIRRLIVALESDAATLVAVREALGAGADWPTIAEASGLSESAAKYRWAGDDAAIAERQDASRRRKRDRPSSRPTDLPGLSVAEAAKQLGVTPQAIYQRVTRGQLEARTIELPDGRSYKRVFPAAAPADE